MIRPVTKFRIRKFPVWVQEGAIVTLLVLIAFILRQAVYVIFFTDSISYLSFAKNILTGIHHGSEISIARYRYPPLYPHLIALFSFGKSDPFILVEVGRQISIVAGSLTIIPLYLLTRKMFNAWAAVLSSLILILTPEFLYYSGVVLTESLSVFILASCFTLLWILSEKKRTPFLYALLGASFGLAFLARHAAIGFLLVSLAWVFVNKIMENGQNKNPGSFFTWVVPVIMIITGFLAVNLPQIIYLHSEIDRWSMTGNFLTDPSKNWLNAGKDIRFTPEGEAMKSLTPDGEKYVFEAEKASGVSSTFSVLLKQPVPFIKAYMKTVAGGYIHDTRTLPYPGIVLVLTAAGIVFLVREKRMKELFFLLWIFAGYYLFLAIFHNIRDRYMFPAYPILLIAAGVGAAGFARLILDSASKRKITFVTEPLVGCAMVTLVFVFLFPSATSLVRDVNSSYNLAYYRAMNEELSGKIEPGAHIFDRNPHRAFFGGGQFTGVPYAPIDKVIKFGQMRDVRYWIVSSDYVQRFRPQFTPLLSNPENYQDYLQPLGIYGNERGRTILFEIVPETR